MKRSFTVSCSLQLGVIAAASSLSVTTSSSNDNSETDVQLAGNIGGLLQQSQKQTSSTQYQQYTNKNPDSVRRH